MASRRYFIVYLAIFVSIFGLIGSAAAREDYFRPASGEVVASLAGKEKAVVTAQGVLNLYSETGRLVAGFPLVIDGETIVSSPLLVDIAGDTSKEIVVISRNVSGQYFLRAYSGDRSLLATASLGETVYYDPAEVRVSGFIKKDILLSTITGKVYTYRFQNNSLNQTLVVDAEKMAGAAASASGQEIVLNFPQENYLSIYTKNGSVWALSKTINVSSSISYPIIYGTGAIIYGVSNGEAMALDRTSGEVVNGFPKSLPGMPIDSPVLADIDSGVSGLELSIALSNGRTVTLSQAGDILTNKLFSKSFLEKSSIISDQGGTGIFSAVSSYGSVVSVNNYKSLVSTLGSLQRPVFGSSLSPQIAVAVAGNAISSSYAYNFGVNFAGIGKNADFIIGNTGAGELNLTGENLMNISGTDADQFSISDYPDSTVSGGASTNFSVRFLPTSPGVKSAVLEFASNDASSSPFVINLSGQAYSAPTVYEDAENGNTLGWSFLYPTYQNSTITNVADSEHGRVIQISQTVAGSQYYRLYKDDGTAWNNATGKILQWDMKTSNETVIYVYITTNKGSKRALYSFARTPNYNGADADFNLSPSFKDGKWHTVTRNLEQDLKRYDNDLVVTKVNYMMVGALGVGKQAWFDNVLMVPDAGYLRTISGTILGNDGLPVSNFKIRLLPDDVYAITSSTGKFAFTSLVDGNYTLQSRTEHYTIPSGSASVILNGSDAANLTINPEFSSTVNYENGEDGTTSGWSLYYPQYLNATITNVEDEDVGRGKVIRLFQTSTPNAQIYKMLKDDGLEWNNTYAKILQWDMKTANETTIYVYLTTNKGSRRALYTFTHAPGYNNADAYFNLPPTLKDGQWHTFTRNIEADLKTYDKDLVITKVNYMLVGSPGVGKEVRIDNVSMSVENNSLHTVSGTIINSSGQPITGVKVALMPDNVYVITTTTGKYAFSSLPNGNYELQSQTEHYTFEASSTSFAVSDADISDRSVIANFFDTVTYEDAENGNTAGWSLLYPQYPNSSISNVADEDPSHGRVIQIAQNVAGSQSYRLYKDNGTEWNNTFGKIVKWDMKVSGETVVYVYVGTNKGLRRAIYSFSRNPNNYTSQDADFALNPAYKDGQWHTITRNVEQDLRKYDKDLVVNKISYVLVGALGAGKQARFDNIIVTTDTGLLRTISGTLSDVSGLPLTNTRVRLVPDNISVITTTTGKFEFTSLSDGNYSLMSQTEHYVFVPTSTGVALSGASAGDLNLTAQFVNEVTYEDGQDGTTNGWSLYYPQYPNSEIRNTEETYNPYNKKFIELVQTVTTGPQYFKLVKDDGNEFNNTYGKILQWEMKTGYDAPIYVYVSTNKGNKRAIYSFNRNANVYTAGDADFNLPLGYLNGDLWHSYTRNVEQDLRKVYGDITVTKINYIMVASPGVNKPVKLDNIKILTDQGQLHTISGILSDASGQIMPNVRIKLMPDNISAVTTTTGRFMFTSIPNGQYTLVSMADHYPLTPNPVNVEISGADYEAHLTAQFQTTVVYEDAETLDIIGWKLYYPQYQNSTIGNVPDEDPAHNRVISLAQSVAGSQYFKFSRPDGTDWNNTNGKVLEWDMKAGNECAMHVYVKTNKGYKRLIYSYTTPTKIVGNDYYFNLGAALLDNQWHSFNRNLNSDAKSVDADLTVLEVNLLLFSSPGLYKSVRLDNIRISAEPVTP